MDGGEDIDALRREVERLRDIEQTFQALFQKSPIGIAYHRVILDDDGRPVDYYFIDANENYVELTGVDPRGKLVTEAFPGIENDPFDWIGTFGRVAINGDTIRFQQHLETNERWYDAVGYQSSPNHFVAAFLEITDAKRKEAELARYRSGLEELVAERTRELERAKEEAEAANRAKTVFLANMSHELRTPLNAVLGYADILHARETDERNQDYLAAIRRSGNALLAMINDVLDVSRIESGRLEVAAVPVSMTDLLDEIRAIFAGPAGTKDLLLQVTVDPELAPVVQSDPVRLRQVLVNLVGNAIKFTASGSVTVSVGSVAQHDERITLLMEVRDTGKGIARSDRARIFDSFVQAAGQRPSDYEGAGLGLAITRRIIDDLNGSIEIDDNPGGGTVFRLSIPDVPLATGARMQDGYPKPETFDLSGTTIAVVDDVEYNRDLLSAYLEPCGAGTIHARDGAEALDLVRRVRPDLVLMDFRLPGIDGLQATRRLKRDPGIAGIPVIVVTASSLPDDEDRIRAVADGYLRKPVPRRVLVAEVARALGIAPGTDRRHAGEEALIDRPLGSALVERIRALVHDGDIAAVEREAARFESQHGGPTRVTRELRRLAHGYDDDAILRLLEECDDA